MGAERPDTEGANSGREEELPVWRILLVILVSAALIALLARGLFLAFDLPRGTELAKPALWTTVVNAIFAKPRTSRDVVVAALVGILVGAVTLLCYLPVNIYIQSFEIEAQRLMLRFLATMFFVGIAVLACWRFWVSVKGRPAKDLS